MICVLAAFPFFHEAPPTLSLMAPKKQLGCLVPPPRIPVMPGVPRKPKPILEPKPKTKTVPPRPESEQKMKTVPPRPESEHESGCNGNAIKKAKVGADFEPEKVITFTEQAVQTDVVFAFAFDLFEHIERQQQHLKASKGKESTPEPLPEPGPLPAGPDGPEVLDESQKTHVTETKIKLSERLPWSWNSEPGADGWDEWEWSRSSSSWESWEWQWRLHG